MREDDRIAALQARIRGLCDELQEVKDRLASMQEAVMEEVDGWLCGDLTRKERLLLGFLVKKRRASKQAIHQFLYANEPGDGAEIKIVDVMICKIRKKLPPGVEIRTLWGEGFELPPASVRILQGMADGEPRKEVAA